jgi:hypothetical protein
VPTPPRSVDAFDDAEVALDRVAEDDQRLLVAALSWAATAWSKLSNSTRTVRSAIPASCAVTRLPRDRTRPPPALTAAAARVL